MTSTSIPSGRGNRGRRSVRHPRRTARLGARSGVDAAVEEARSVDESRSRGAARANTHRRPHSDTWLAALYASGLGAWLLYAPPTGANFAVLAACITAHAVASSIEFEIGPGSVVPTTAVLVACLFLVPAQLVPVVAIASPF